MRSSKHYYAQFTRKARTLHLEVNRLNMVKKSEEKEDSHAEAIIAIEKKTKRWKKKYRELGDRAA